MPRSFSCPSARSALLFATLPLLGCGELSDGTPRTPPPVDPLHLEINNSRGMEYVNGSLLVTVQTQGGTPDKIELLRSGEPLATLLPPFQFTWDTTVFREGAESSPHLSRASRAVPSGWLVPEQRGKRQ
ncbi:hypothetical protein MYMAC_006422 [Corallococcus macrosporus DSM 14697]|uniref:Lipoprotein n=1 Tax=Corallococcus macrosporus DSM 14697 TaxID=1189310 RepID=A0A250K605_9BACT|nr:hypothetical protein MYMAC_006422 [Corallococcus macrosporus DSM 14697]